MARAKAAPGGGGGAAGADEGLPLTALVQLVPLGSAVPFRVIPAFPTFRHPRERGGARGGEALSPAALGPGYLLRKFRGDGWGEARGFQGMVHGTEPKALA